jgi:hypothetical protein
MSEVATYGIEALVGIACLVAAHGVRRRAGLRLAAALLALAGIAAATHAVLSLV